MTSQSNSNVNLICFLGWLVVCISDYTVMQGDRVWFSDRERPSRQAGEDERVCGAWIMPKSAQFKCQTLSNRTLCFQGKWCNVIIPLCVVCSEGCWGLLLAQQDLALRAVDKSGIFNQLLIYKAEGDAELTMWLKGHFDFVSPQIKNEILKLTGNTVVKKIATEVTSLTVVQVIRIINGTHDISGVVQESLFLWFLEAGLQPK